jgi:hypothetical protein
MLEAHLVRHQIAINERLFSDLRDGLHIAGDKLRWRRKEPEMDRAGFNRDSKPSRGNIWPPSAPRVAWKSSRLSTIRYRRNMKYYEALVFSDSGPNFARRESNNNRARLQLTRPAAESGGAVIRVYASIHVFIFLWLRRGATHW